jgi:ketosteroid isomerase-like protein
MPESHGVTIAFLEAFLDVWNRHDLDAIVDMLEPDCEYITSAGVHLRGHEAIRAGLGDFLKSFPDAHWRDAQHFVCGERGASEWIFSATTADGVRVERDACDLFAFRNGRIAVVSAFGRERAG